MISTTLTTKKIKIMIIVISLLSLLYFLIYFIQNIHIKQSFVKSTGQPMDNQHALIRCNLNIFKPEFAYVFFDENISFESVNKIFWSYKDWDNSYEGGTTVYNSSFENNVQMLKKDCNQFKKNHGTGENNEIYWMYYKKTEPLENAVDNRKRKYSKELEEFMLQKLKETNLYTEKELEEFVKRFKDIGYMPDEDWELFNKPVEERRKILLDIKNNPQTYDPEQDSPEAIDRVWREYMEDPVIKEITNQMTH